MSAVVVTGAAGGIGRALVEAFAGRYRPLYLLDDRADKLRELVEAVGGDEAAFEVIECDVSQGVQVKAAFDRIGGKGAGVEGLVNCAAVVNLHAHVLDLEEGDWDRVTGVNLKGSFLCLQAAARIMAERGKGSIINIGSISSRRAHREQAAYDAAKGGVEALTRAAALDLAPYGIRVNAVLPAAISTPEMVQHDEKEFAAKMRLVPLNRYGRPEEVAEVCEFLLEKGTFITGQCIIVDGGLEAQMRPLDAEYLESPRFKRESQG